MKRPNKIDPRKDPRYAPWMEQAMAFTKPRQIEGFIRDGGWSRARAEAQWKNKGEPEQWDYLLRGNFYSFDDYIERRGQPREAGELSATTDPLQGMHQLTYDDLIDMWQKAQTLPEPDRQKAIRYITHLSTRLESQPAVFLTNILLETQF